MTMVVTPRRNEEVLTHRTGANRRLGGDIETDSTFERDDDSKQGPDHQHHHQQHHQLHANSMRSSPSSSNHHQGEDVQRKRRRRKKPNDNPCSYVRPGVALLLVLLVVIGIFQVLFFASTAAVRPNKATSEHPQFQQFSLDAQTSCNSHPLEESEVAFTLVTQVSSDRLWMMEHHCHRWKLNNESYYPISIAVLSDDPLTKVRHTLRDFGCDMNLMSVQVVPASDYPSHEYPVNILRNIALRQVKTSHVMYVDVDFWISRDMSSILQYPEVTELLASDPKATLVIPAFQLARQCHQWRECPEKNIPYMPHDLLELKTQIVNKKVTRFDPTNRGGHGSTKYKDWFHQNRQDGEVLVEIDCFLSNRYEPYLVFRYCQELPPFQEPFSGYGKNKMTWVMQLRRMGYTFWQLGKGAFVIHYPHLDSPSRVAWNNAPKRRDALIINGTTSCKRCQMDQLFVEFRQWLQLKVPDMTQVPFCDDKLDDDARLLYDRGSFNKSVAYLLDE